MQAGIGAIPNAILSLLHDRRNLGIHTELVSDGVMDLLESGALTGTQKVTRPGKIVTTFALGTQRLYDFLNDNAAVEFLPVDWVNDPRVIGREHRFVSINATVEVDLLGQCNSEMIGGRYYSGSGGQADFARGAMYSRAGQGFVVLHSTTSDESDVAHRRPALPGRTGDDAEEHRRPRRHRVRRRRAARPLDRATAPARSSGSRTRSPAELEKKAHELGYLRT